MTYFIEIYDRFLSKITDSLYIELTKEETYAMLQELLISAIRGFRFPRVNLENYTLGFLKKTDSGRLLTDGTPEYTYEWVDGQFEEILSNEEKEILAMNMMILWLTQQIATIENIKMKMSGADFKISSQASHLKALLVVKESYEEQNRIAQNLYSRRKLNNNGIYQSTMGQIMTTPNYGYFSEELT